MKQFILMTGALLVILSVGFSFIPQETDPQKKEAQVSGSIHQNKERYVCPMHPDVTSDKPGKCSKCGMDLVKKESNESTEQRKDEMESMCAQMCAMMMKHPSMMNMMHGPMLGEMKEGSSDSTHSETARKNTMMSCCEGMMKKKNERHP